MTVTAHKGLADALAALQAEVPTFTKSKTARAGSYTYSYADLGDILPTVGPILSKHGLSWSSKPGCNDAGELVLAYRLLHASGEADCGEMPLGVPRGCKPQELGSAITYARRYAITAQLNLATEDDDDGQVAQGASRGQSRPQATAQPAKTGQTPASAAQRRMINGRASEKGMSADALANIVRGALGEEPRDFTEESGRKWLDRYMDRLPGTKVDLVLKAIEALA